MEEKTNQNERSIKEHSLTSRIIFVSILILVAAIILGVITSIVLLLFPVTEIEVVGDSRYNYSEIIDGSGIKKGARLYFLDEGKAEERLLSKFSYLEQVRVDTYFPNRVKIEIDEFEDVYLISHVDGFCYVNGNFEILEIVDLAPDYERFSGVFIKLERNAEGGVGDILQYEGVQRASELIRIVKEYGFYDRLNIVDVENKYDNAFVVGKKYKFVIGAMTDVSEKIDVAFKVCLSDSFANEKNAIIDATDKKKVILRYVDDENIRKEFDFCQKQ